MMITAAIVVIGNEILSGRTIDKNISHIANRLKQQGIQLSHVRIIADIEQEIIDNVLELSQKYDHVMTTGGIGPTHDDITSESLAKAFNEPYEIHAQAYDILDQYYQSRDAEFNEGRVRMAKMPRNVTLIENPLTAAPGFTIRNVHVLPGVPKIMQQMLEILLKRLGHGPIKHEETIESPFPESEIALFLSEMQAKYSDIDIGSYPHFSENMIGFKNQIVIRAFDKNQLKQCFDDINAYIIKHRQ